MVDTHHAKSEVPLMRPTVGTRGEVSVEMTASSLISLVVNVVQNQWPLDVPGCDSAAMRVVMEEVFEQLIQGNRQALSERYRISDETQVGESRGRMRGK